jgi:hypothetical protein
MLAPKPDALDVRRYLRNGRQWPMEWLMLLVEGAQTARAAAGGTEKTLAG